MTTVTLPLDMANHDRTDDLKINMAKLEFPVSKDVAVRAAFVYIRNISFKGLYDFSECPYEMKEEYLMLFMTGTFNINIPNLAATWVEILLHDEFGRIAVYESILNSDETDRFISAHRDLVNELRHIFESMPLFAIKFYTEHCEDKDRITGFDEIETSDFCDANKNAIIQMLDYEDCVLLASPAPGSGVVPTMYTKYFQSSENSLIKAVMEKLPFLGMLNLMFAPNETQDEFLRRLKEMIDPKEDDNERRDQPVSDA